MLPRTPVGWSYSATVRTGRIRSTWRRTWRPGSGRYRGTRRAADAAAGEVVDRALAEESWPTGALRVAGIDGSVSTAAGIALATHAPCYAFLGDLTFLHDTNGLLIGPTEQRPDLTAVVVNDDGGGIFGLLEQGAPDKLAAALRPETGLRVLEIRVNRPDRDWQSALFAGVRAAVART